MLSTTKRTVFTFAYFVSGSSLLSKNGGVFLYLNFTAAFWGDQLFFGAELFYIQAKWDEVRLTYLFNNKWKEIKLDSILSIPSFSIFWNKGWCPLIRYFQPKDQRNLKMKYPSGLHPRMGVGEMDKRTHERKVEVGYFVYILVN